MKRSTAILVHGFEIALTIALCAGLTNDAAGQTSCLSPPSGLVNWWTADGNTYDFIGTLDDTLYNGAGFATGEVGVAFSFDGINNCITNGTPGLTNILNSYTMEFWAWPVASRASTAELNAGIEGTSGQRYAIFPTYGGVGNVGSGVSVGTNGISVFEHGNAYLPSLLVYDAPITGWTHIAVVYQNQQPSLYVNGTLTRTGLASLRNSYPSTWLGEWGAQSLNYGYYAGLLDEFSIYNRALSPSEILAIFNAGAAGKCRPPPTPPSIFSQPTNQIAARGGSASFTVGVSGSRPFSYQWMFGGLPVVGGTNSSLNLLNVQTNQAGSYTVLVTNLGGSITSAPATLVVTLPPLCTTPAAGLVSWWRAETNTWDQIGGNNGTFLNGASFAPGEVGWAFNFDGSGNNVNVPAAPSLDVGNGPGFSIEAWINPGDLNSGRPIFEWALPNAYGVHFWLNSPNPGCLYANLADTAGGLHIIQSPPGVLTNYGFQHVALTYDKALGAALLFVNGLVVQSNSLGSINGRTSSNVYIGYRPVGSPFGPIPFIGLIDEVSLYNRALAPGEIGAIYNAGGSGKCVAPAQPFIVTQPTNQTVTLTSNAVFYVGAGGTPPLNFQWSFNGTNLTGATNNPLILTNVQSSQAGNYSVLVTNAYGFAQSSNALLTLRYPPAVIQMVSNYVAGGSTLTMPVLVTANGNENALGFSLNFDTTKLIYAGAILGSGASDAVLLPNTSLVASGKLGVSLALPPNETLAAGRQQVVQVSFVAAVLSNTAPTTISFGDQPTPRQLWDTQLTSLSAVYSNSPVLIGLQYPPASVMLASNNVPGGGTLTMPVLVAANGNENTLSFSLNFDTTKLTYAGLTGGSGAPNAVLTPNTSLLVSGKLGLTLTLPPNQTLAPGTQEVARISFAAAVVNVAALTTISFGDQPTTRQLWDAQRASLAAYYSNALVSIGVVTAFEGDAYPRPSGDKAVTLSDWLLIGRYVAGLDFPTNAAEFQRVDCAPRMFAGDGAISIADWVQAGRFAAGFDPLTAAGGPTSPNPWFGAGPSTNRLLAVGTTLLTPGQPCTVSVTLTTQGNENALGFSLSFDPALVTFIGASPGPDAMNATVYVNANQAASGQLGFALALGSGSAFPTGNRQLITLNFRAAPSASGSFAPDFRDQPVLRDVADVAANSLAVGFVSGSISQNLLATLNIAKSGPNVALTWPLWATNLTLQQAGSLSQNIGSWTNVPVAAVATNNANVLTLPMNSSPMFYRLSPR